MYVDADGREGTSSCLFQSSWVAADFATAEAACIVEGAHLATFASNNTGLYAAAMSSWLKDAAGVFVGCKQSPSAKSQIAGWTWVDGTPATMLNCGRSGCGLWMPGEPSDSGCTGEGHCEDYCVWDVGLLNDVPANAPSTFLCEFDMVTGEWQCCRVALSFAN